MSCFALPNARIHGTVVFIFMGPCKAKRQRRLFVYGKYLNPMNPMKILIVSYNTANWNPSHFNSPGFDSHLPLTPFRKLCKCLVGKCQLVGFGWLAFRTLHANPKNVTLLKFNEPRPCKGRPKSTKGRQQHLPFASFFRGELFNFCGSEEKWSLGHSCREQGLRLMMLIIEILSKTERSCKRECFPCFTHRLFCIFLVPGCPRKLIKVL